MPEVRATRGVRLPLDRIWPYVEDVGRWAPLVEGYVAHEVLDPRTMIWTLRGDLGPFSREVRCRIAITEWTAPRRVAFELTGIDEAVTGRGAFDLTEAVPELPALPARPWWRRLMDRLFGRRAPPPPRPDATAHVVFTFAVSAQGPMGPMIDALLGPWSEQVAQRLLDRVGEQLEGKDRLGEATGAAGRAARESA